jgi:hypothetical protein
LSQRNNQAELSSVAWWYQGAAGRTELAVHPLVADSEALLERGQHVALLERLLEQAPILFARAEPKDAECCFLVMANIVPRLPHQVRRPLARSLPGLLEPQPFSQWSRADGGCWRLATIASRNAPT